MDLMTRLKKQIKDSTMRIVLPEGNDERIILAAEELVKQGIALPILIGNAAEIGGIAERQGTDLTSVEIVDPQESEKFDAYVEALTEAGSLPAQTIKILMKKPLYFASMMLKMNDADGMVAGCATPTNEIVLVATLVIGIREGFETPSTYYIMDIPGFEGSEGSLIAMADPAINIEPSAEALADIAIATSTSVEVLLGWEPRVAMLSFSTHGSAAHARIDKVTKAVEIIRKRQPDLKVDGELQLDAAIIPSVAASKVKIPSEVAGRANILIFPDIEAANIGVKLIQRFANSTSYGVFMQGFARPVSDVSRGSTVEDIANACTVVAIQAQASKRE